MDTNPMPVCAPEGGAVLFVSSPDARREELCKLLQAAGCRALFPPTADEARGRIQNGDLLLLKVPTVGPGELALLDALRQAETGWHVPVVLIEEQPGPDTRRQCLERGALDCLAWPVDPVIFQARVRAGVDKKRRMDEAFRACELALKEQAHAEALVSSVIPLSEAMMSGKTPIQLLEMILVESMRITDCEGGSIYMRTDDDRLQFVLVRNDMLDINMGGSVGKPITFEPLRLFDPTGKPVHQYVANHATLTGTVVNIADAYAAGRFDFSGTRKFDANTGYRSKSFLTLPLKNHRQRVIGILQLINARDPRVGAIVPFNTDLQPTIEGLSLLAAAVMEAYRATQGQVKAT